MRAWLRRLGARDVAWEHATIDENVTRIKLQSISLRGFYYGLWSPTLGNRYKSVVMEDWPKSALYLFP